MFSRSWLDPQAARGQSKPGPEKSKGPDPAVIKAATEFMKKVHESLYSRKSIQADIEQAVSIGAQQFEVTGHYASSGNKLRLEYNVKPDQGISGSLLEICDGKELWSLTKVADTQRVTHRDVEQIKAAVTSTKSVPEAVLTAELGLGGLTALLASLERTMIFDAMKEVSNDDGTRMVIEGRWKPEIAVRWQRTKDDLLPAFVPDTVRLWIDPQTQFPTRIVYIKRVIEKDKKINRPMVSLKFRNVQFDEPIDDQAFIFVPPPDIEPEDITGVFLERIKREEANGAAKAPVDPAAPK